jgi:2-polyprenyl-3-methyl-5-hydroxy-6-metoxy-1,4-benzoquinol methylase
MTPLPPDRLAKLKSLTYEAFRERARDASLSPSEKIGFPDSYRAGKAELIQADLAAKLPALSRPSAAVVDIGCGCGELPELIAKNAQRLHQTLWLLDSAEMLALVPDSPVVRKVSARFPDCAAFIDDMAGRAEAVIVYSVLQYVFVEGNTWAFVDAAMRLLAPGGALLLGDIPNVSKRRRFFASDAGVRHHQEYTGTDGRPAVEFNRPDPGEIDDSVVFAILQRARLHGFDSYVMPQSAELPMANRREDILVVRP